MIGGRVVVCQLLAALFQVRKNKQRRRLLLFDRRKM